MWVLHSVRLLLQAGWQEEEELMCVGGGAGKKMSNAMSHSALAAGRGRRGGGVDERGRRERILLHVV